MNVNRKIIKITGATVSFVCLCLPLRCNSFGSSLMPLVKKPPRIQMRTTRIGQTYQNTPSRYSHNRNVSVTQQMMRSEHQATGEDELVAATVVESGSPSLVDTWHNIRNAAAFNLSPQKVLSVLAAFVFMISVLFTPLQDAFAAPTGGRMGGSFGGSSSSRQQQRSSTPRYSAPSYNRGFSQGYSTGYLSRPPVVISPWSFGGGFGYSPFFNPFWSSPRGVIVSTGPSIFDVVAFGIVGFIFVSVATSAFRSTTDSEGAFFQSSSSSALGPGVTVAEISVAVNVSRRDDQQSILNFLLRLSSTANTDSRVGVANLVSQVALELLRQRRSIVSANTSYNHYRDGDRAQREFSAITIRERSKFERETINKYGGVDYTGTSSGRLLPGGTSSARATMAVISLIVAIDGDRTKLPKINSFSDVEKALTTIATDVKVSNCLRSAEILWTPEDSDDVLTEQDVAADYPSLRNV